MPYQESDVCTDVFEQFSLTFDESIQMCAGGVVGEDSCNGDSGGPLVVRERADHPWYQVGVVSFGDTVCTRGTPGIYTRVEAFLPWIAQNMV